MAAPHRNVFMFSGQGSQYYQMGRSLYEQGGTFTRSMRAMDQMVQDLGCPSVLKTLYGDHARGTPFDALVLSHPAIFMVEFALAQTVLEMGIEPHLTLGVSLGSVAASVIAGALSLEEALSWVVRYSSWVVEHCDRGAMLGVLAPQQLHEAEPLRHSSVIAAQNGPAHWVLSTREAGLLGVEAFLKAQNVAFGRLPVHYAFHSPWLLKDRASAFAQVRAPQARPPRIPIACCAEGGILGGLGADYFWTTTLEPIRFERTIRQLEARTEDWRYLDLGPSSTLATLLKYLLPTSSASRFQGVLSPYGREPANLTALAAWRGN